MCRPTLQFCEQLFLGYHLIRFFHSISSSDRHLPWLQCLARGAARAPSLAICSCSIWRFYHGPAKETGIKIGMGPTFVFPTATSTSAGQGAWQAGPAFAAGYTGVPWFVAGFLFQNPVAFAYTSSRRTPLSTIEFQPILQVSVWRGWYLKSADASWNLGWRSHSPTMLPLSLGVGRVMVRPGLPLVNFYVSGQWMAYRQFAPVAPQTSVNFGITVGFPQFMR